MSSRLLRLDVRQSMISLGNQIALFDLTENQRWYTDLDTGTLCFGDQYHWQIQLLGTESEASGTWLWSWANAVNDIPAPLLVASFAVKAYGEQNGIPELTTPQLPLDQIDGHTLALLASGICEANAYYRCPYEGGALFVLIMDETFPKCTDPPLQRIATVFPQAIASLEIPDHQLALRGYLDSYGLAHEVAGNQIVVKENGEPVLTATFDEQNRLTNLEVRLEARADSPTAAPSESWDQAQWRRLLNG